MKVYRVRGIKMKMITKEWIRDYVKDTYPNLKVGSLNYYCGSFHAYNEDLSNWVIY